MTDYISAICLKYTNSTAWDALVEMFRKQSSNGDSASVTEMKLLDDGDIMIRKRNGELEVCEYHGDADPEYFGTWYQYRPKNGDWKCMGVRGWPEDPRRAQSQAQI